MRISIRLIAVVIAFSLALLTGSNLVSAREVIQEDYLISGLGPGIKLHIREKVLKDMKSFSEDNIILFVHGATYPSPTMFDLEVKRYSFME